MEEKKKKKKTGLSYLDYFDGYTDIKIPKKNGKGFKYDRVYTAEFYAHELTDAEWKKTKAVYAGFVAAIIALVMAAGFQDIPGNRARGCVLFLGLSLFCLLFLATWVIYFIFTGRRMTRWTKTRIHDGIYKWSMYGSLVLILCTVSRFVYACFFAQGNYLAEAFGGFLFLIASVLMISIHRMEDHMTFEEIYNEDSEMYPPVRW